jgi:hypothetical protein
MSGVASGAVRAIRGMGQRFGDVRLPGDSRYAWQQSPRLRRACAVREADMELSGALDRATQREWRQVASPSPTAPGVVAAHATARRCRATGGEPPKRLSKRSLGSRTRCRSKGSTQMTDYSHRDPMAETPVGGRRRDTAGAHPWEAGRASLVAPTRGRTRPLRSCWETTAAGCCFACGCGVCRGAVRPV